MIQDALEMSECPSLREARMLLSFSGWMDGGEVSTGTAEWLVRALSAREVGHIQPEEFYIFNFPGSMELSALFRPYVNIQDGRIEDYQTPRNVLYCDPVHNLVLFAGKEPNLRWGKFAQCLFTAARKLQVQTLYFVGSVAGLAPHTREPRLFCTVSHPDLKPQMEAIGVRFTNYQGPSSFITYLMTEVERQGLHMISLVAEIPAYVQGVNPKSIEAVGRMLASLLGLQINFEQIRGQSDEWERKLNDVLLERTDLAEHIRKLEEDYDNEVFNTQMGDLKDWLEQKGVRLD